MTDYNRTQEAQVRFEEKKKPKNPIKFKISLNEEQKQAKEEVLNNTVILLQGIAGSGKTILACQIGLNLLFNKEIEKIIITRPTVGASRDIGYLPGDIKDKMDPWLAPIYSNLYTLYDKIAIDKLIEEQKIEILPINFARGRTFVNSFIIVDECQNIDNRETELMIGRLGKFSRMVFCGDVYQIDLINKKNSGISFFKTLESNVKGVKVISLKQNHRHEIVPQILDIYKQYE